MKKKDKLKIKTAHLLLWRKLAQIGWLYADILEKDQRKTSNKERKEP